MNQPNLFSLNRTEQFPNIVTNPNNAGFLTKWGGLIFMILTMLTSWSLNITLIVAIIRIPCPRHINYLYIISMNVMAVMNSLFNFPSNLLFDVIDSHKQSDAMCIIWIFAETALCHAVQLHLLGSSLDTYLRLLKPRWYGQTGGRPATKRIKLAAPWIVAYLQTIAQVLLGDPFPPSQLDQTRFCVCPDVNFLILRTCMAFVLPLLVSIILLFMAARNLRRIYGKEFRDQIQGEETNLDDGKFNTTEQSMSKFLSDSGISLPRKETLVNLALNVACTGATEEDVQENRSGRCKQAMTHDDYIKREFQPNAQTELSSPESYSASLCPPSTTNFQTHESNSSDTGISSQTTDDNEALAKLLLCVQNHPYENQSTISHSKKPVNGQTFEDFCAHTVPTSLKIMDHFCPKHGHVLVSVQTHSNFERIVPEIEVAEEDVNTYTDVLSLNVDNTNQNISTKSDLKEQQLPGEKTYEEPGECYAVVVNAERILDEVKDSSTSYDVNVVKTEVPDTSFAGRPSTLSIQETSRLQQSVKLKKIMIERTAIKLNMVTCALSIALWAPYISATLAYLLLTATRFDRIISVETLIQFKWLSYMTCVAYTLGYLIVDGELRNAVFNVFRRSA
ncbi:hypothetical protein EG68_01267 [Paragonimus skrjabini miyazakii]|uniref:G-protein coupled receptors family 1 profile domain-containing protein n=1 Tax=Paragonimus skrjabini miyazakii TaxID=59628 RepID=A0A8S9Z1U3_9TREM|nr:hypothetical protein EG68_01267 [Paragonimus skrjabini miyazakii]